MTFALRLGLSVCLLLAIAAGWCLLRAIPLQAAEPVGQPKDSAPEVAKPDATKQDATLPVEADMHEFMEYIFQPTFKRLKPAMAAAPADNQGWKAIKADSLILAESGNLLLQRQPDDDAADWVKHSVQVRDFGGQLYRAAKAKDYTTARTHYEAMVQSCNACHQQFAGGEHILEP